ncbi:hypothetical protein FIV42_01695 [Persicimonas caeni]|uniref:BIG2 domain-containing protein n=1 Tax=Persicimonas caeni TaxID=2292766 RepID=A0A4Y6PNW1_PERCE|nr:Ig-like domain-containing protein [Persicimonas caeni]QDG49495.1 hypothetical protein FIV42_01695 [Persicimonas caeni]QED30716.1 hypothetical protein FRD00_01690 [Persicimonas caeni]
MRIYTLVLLVCFVAACSGAPSDGAPGAGGAEDSNGAPDLGPFYDVEHVWMSPAKLRLAVGEQATIEADARDAAIEEVDNPDILWRSTDPAVARVDQQGVVEAVGAGQAVIEAVADGDTGRCEVEVYEPLESVAIAGVDDTFRPGVVVEPVLQLTGVLGNELDPDDWAPNWSSDDDQVLEHLGDGRFAALRPGVTEIAVVVGGKSAAARVEVGGYADLQIRLDAERWRVHRGETLEITASVLGPGGEIELDHVAVNWESEAPSLLEVDAAGLATGLATGKALGTVSVRASAHGASAERDVLVVGVYSSIDSGRRHTCGIYDIYTVCWGLNLRGQLGTGDLTSRAVPTLVVGGHRFTSVSAGGDFSCGLDADGRAWCWGANEHGQLGDGTRSRHTEPTAVQTHVKFVAITAGFQHACALDLAGNAWCWGSGADGRLGIGHTDDSVTPSPVVGGLRFRAIDAAEHTCAITTDGQATYCWGNNDYGEIGATPKFTFASTDLASSAEPWVVTQSRSFEQVRAGDDFSCALADDGEIFCWGSNVDYQLGRTIYSSGGDVITSFRSVSWPVSLHEDPVSYTAVSAGYHPCAIRDGKPYCWREDFHGDPTSPGFVPVTEPTRLRGLAEASAITGGYKFTCALDEEGYAYCSGWGVDGELGSGSMQEYVWGSFVPVVLPTVESSQ